MKFSLAVLLVTCVVVAHAALPVLQKRPIFGIVTVPDQDEQVESEISASYVKFLESAGARVAVIPYRSSEAELRRLFRSVNGILFPGGGLSLLPNTTFYKTSRLLFDLAKEEWERGVNFPLHGTCMGFQLLCVLVAEDNSVLLQYHYDSENLPLPLEFTPAAAHSRLFGSSPPPLFAAMARENLTMNLHHDGVPPSMFHSNPKLREEMNILAVNQDRRGRPFVSAMEGKKFPIFGVQFHPERNAYEWDDDIEKLPHSLHAVQMMQQLANVLVQEARKNDHRFESREEERKALIYAHTPVYTEDDKGPGFRDEQTYVFH